MDIPVDESQKSVSIDDESRSGDRDEASKDNDDPKEFNIYEEGIIFIDPIMIITPKHSSCLTLKT
jgi:hypothetical protein